MKKSAFEKAEKKSDVDTSLHAFQPVNSGTSIINPKAEANISSSLRRSARTNTRPSRQNYRNASSFQHSDSHNDQSISLSENEYEESDVDKHDFNPQK